MKIQLFVARAFNLPTHAFDLATRAFSVLSREFELITCRFELVTRRFKLVTRGFELVTRNSCFTFPQFFSAQENSVFFISHPPSHPYTNILRSCIKYTYLF